MDKILLFSSCFIAVIADMLMVWWAKHYDHPLWTILVAGVLNTVGMIIWCYSMKKGVESSVAIVVYALATSAGCSILGFMIFNETISRTNAAGMVMGVISFILMMRK
jgi:drug/metabolite transporter (DMT)-like permease